MLVARGSSGHGVVNGAVWRLRAECGVLHEAQTVEVIGQDDDGLVVTARPRWDPVAAADGDG